MKLKDTNKIINKLRNKIGVEVINFNQSVNNLLRNKELINKGYNVYIPYNLVTSKGIVRRVDPGMTEKELKNIIILITIYSQ